MMTFSATFCKLSNLGLEIPQPKPAYDHQFEFLWAFDQGLNRLGSKGYALEQGLAQTFPEIVARVSPCTNNLFRFFLKLTIIFIWIGIPIDSTRARPQYVLEHFKFLRFLKFGYVFREECS